MKKIIVIIVLVLLFCPFPKPKGYVCDAVTCDSYNSFAKILWNKIKNSDHRTPVVSQSSEMDENQKLTNDESVNPCPYMLAKDDMFKIVLTHCAQQFLPDGKTLEGGYSASQIEIQKLDGTPVRSFDDKGFAFSPNEAGTITAKMIHDNTNSYIFLEQSTWVVGSLRIFSLITGESHLVTSYENGLVTKNGYLVYTSADGLKNVHPEVDQSNATNVVVLKLSDLTQTVLYTGTKSIDYRVNVDYLGDQDDLNLQYDFVEIMKYARMPGQQYPELTQIKVPITSLVK